MGVPMDLRMSLLPIRRGGTLEGENRRKRWHVTLEGL